MQKHKLRKTGLEKTSRNQPDLKQDHPTIQETMHRKWNTKSHLKFWCLRFFKDIQKSYLGHPEIISKFKLNSPNTFKSTGS